jgi:hypothetical protein
MAPTSSLLIPTSSLNTTPRKQQGRKALLGGDQADFDLKQSKANWRLDCEHAPPQEVQVSSSKPAARGGNRQIMYIHKATGHNQRIIPLEEGWNDEINHCQPIVGAPIMSLRHVVDMKKEILLQV